MKLRHPSDVFPYKTIYSLEQHEADARTVWERHPFQHDWQVDAFVYSIVRGVGPIPEALRAAIARLFFLEGIYEPEFRPIPSHDYYDDLMRQLSPDRIARAMREAEQIAKRIIAHLPSERGIPFADVPLISAAKDPKKLLNDIQFRGQQSKEKYSHAFPKHSAIMQANAWNEEANRYIDPKDCNLEPEKMGKRYLKGTVFAELFSTPSHLRMQTRPRMSHLHLLAPTDYGKSELLGRIMMGDIESPDRPALLLIEPKGDFVQSIASLTAFRDEPERLQLIEPALAPPMNLFAFPPGETRTSDQLVEQFEFIFKAMDAEIEGPQATALAHVAQVVIAREGNMQTFHDVLTHQSKTVENSRYGETMIGLDDQIAVNFFREIYYKGQSPTSRASLANKVDRLLRKSPLFRAMLYAKENVVDVYGRLATPGSVTLVSTALGNRAASSMMGRWFISQVYLAADRRKLLLPHERNPCFVIIDEAHDYFEGLSTKEFEDMLVQTRSANIGITFAHNQLDKLKPSSLKTTILGQPATIIAAPVPSDVSDIQAAMRMKSPELLKSLAQRRGVDAEFAYYCRGETETPARFTVTYGQMAKVPRMGEREFAAFRERFRGPRPSDKPTEAAPSAEQPTPSEQPEPPPIIDEIEEGDPKPKWTKKGPKE